MASFTNISIITILLDNGGLLKFSCGIKFKFYFQFLVCQLKPKAFFGKTCGVKIYYLKTAEVTKKKPQA